MSGQHHESSGGHGSTGQRGVTRPMPLIHAQPADDDSDEQHSSAKEQGRHDDNRHDMSRDDRLRMLHMHHRQTLWVYWTLVMLGLWTALAPFTFGCGSAVT